MNVLVLEMLNASEQKGNRVLILRPLYIVIVSLLLFVCISVSLRSNILISIDQWLINYIQQYESNPLTLAMKTITFIGSIPFFTILVIAVVPVLIIFKHRAQVMVVIVAVSGSAFLNHMLKLIFERSRPSIHSISVEAGYSFPSGHSMNAFVFYGIVSLFIMDIYKESYCEI